ncbi:unnamed protein product [Prorocentrum cordatum]|uniref:RRM domain-containing protein n=1 Tax=Prorocentrum cordatum TaxID=2364126 RepID=A0ABN9T8K2_9DINO|nr:unnamed protein product [Polarella glacialis]
MASEVSSAVEEFLFAAEGLDEKASQALRDADPEVQKAVLARGDLTGTRDPSAALIARIRNKGMGGKGGGAAAAVAAVDVEAYLAENDPLDERAQTALRTAPAWVQAGVVAGGEVKGAKNPSAALIARLNTIQTGGGGGGPDPWGGWGGMGGWGGKGWGGWGKGWGKGWGGSADPWSLGFQMGFGGSGGGWGGGWGDRTSWESKDVTTRYLLNGLPEGATEDEIRTYFGAFSKIEEVTLKKIESNGKIVGSVKFSEPTIKLRDQMLKEKHEILGTAIEVITYKMQKQQKPGYAAKKEAETAKYLAEKANKGAGKGSGMAPF